MGLITSTINFVYGLRNEIDEALTDNGTQRNKILFKKFKNEKDELKNRNDIEIMRLEVQQESKVRSKSMLYAGISSTASFISILLSVGGLTGANSFSDMFSSAGNITIVLLMTFVSFTVWITSFQSEFLKRKYYDNYSKLIAIQSAVIVISVISNCKFLVSYIKPTSFFEYIYLGIFSVALDAISLSYSSASQAVKFRNYSNKNNDVVKNANVLDMLKFVIGCRFKIWLKGKYDYLLEDYCAAFGVKNGLKNGSKISDQKTLKNLENKPLSTNIIRDDFEVNGIENISENRKLRRNNNRYENAVERLKTFDNDSKITAADLKVRESDWRKFRKKMVRDGLIYTAGSYCYKRAM